MDARVPSTLSSVKLREKKSLCSFECECECLGRNAHVGGDRVVVDVVAVVVVVSLSVVPGMVFSHPRNREIAKSGHGGTQR